MTISTNIDYQPMAVSAEVKTMNVSAVPVLEQSQVNTSMVRGIRTLANLVLGICLVAAPTPSIQAKVCYIDEVIPMPYHSNFITADGKYILLADGKIFSVKKG